MARSYRTSGLFDAVYGLHRAHFTDRFDLVVTEIARRNACSLRAHTRVGFQTIAEHRDAADDWVIVALELRARPSVG